MTNSKAKPATHPWRKHGDGEITPSDQHGVFVRTLTAAEYQHFKDTKELPKVGNVSVVKDNPFGRLIWRPGLEWIAENVRDRRIAQRVEQIEGEARPRLAAASIADEWADERLHGPRSASSFLRARRTCARAGCRAPTRVTQSR